MRRHRARTRGAGRRDRRPRRGRARRRARWPGSPSLAAFCALLVHTIGYAGYLTDPITWVLLAVGAALAPSPLPPLSNLLRALIGYLRRLATTGAAYTASSVLSKLIAVALLPLYTRLPLAGGLRRGRGADRRRDRGQHRHPPRDHRGAAALLLRARRGPRPGRQDRRSPRCSGPRPPGCAIALPFAEPLSAAAARPLRPGLVRIAIGGLWVFTLWEFLLALFRIDERAKAYLVFTVANVLVTIPVTVWLVVVEERGAEGLLLGQYATGAVFLGVLLVMHRRRLALIPDFGAAAPDDPLRPADDAGRALALLAQLHRPAADRAPDRARRRRALRARRSSSPRRSTSSSRASSSPGRRSPIRSRTTTRPAAPTR